MFMGQAYTYISRKSSARFSQRNFIKHMTRLILQWVRELREAAVTGRSSMDAPKKVYNSPYVPTIPNFVPTARFGRS